MVFLYCGNLGNVNARLLNALNGNLLSWYFSSEDTKNGNLINVNTRLLKALAGILLSWYFCAVNVTLKI